MPYMPAPTPPKTTSLSIMLASGTMPPKRRERVVPSVNGAATGIGRDGRPEGGIGNAEADFFAFHISARLHCAGALIGSSQQRIAASFRPIGHGYAREKQNDHGRPHRPAMPLRAGHTSQRVSESAADRENAEPAQSGLKAESDFQTDGRCLH